MSFLCIIKKCNKHIIITLISLALGYTRCKYLILKQFSFFKKTVLYFSCKVIKIELCKNSAVTMKHWITAPVQQLWCSESTSCEIKVQTGEGQCFQPVQDQAVKKWNDSQVFPLEVVHYKWLCMSRICSDNSFCNDPSI